MQMLPYVVIVIIIALVHTERTALKHQIKNVAEMEEKKFLEILSFTKSCISSIKVLEVRIMILELTMGHRDYKSVSDVVSSLKSPEFFVEEHVIKDVKELLEELVVYYNIPKS